MFTSRWQLLVDEIFSYHVYEPLKGPSAKKKTQNMLDMWCMFVLLVALVQNKWIMEDSD